MSGALATKDRLGTLKGLISGEKMQKQFALALPRHMTPERFSRIAITALTKAPKLQEATQESLFQCLLDLSAMGLEPDGRNAHLIPFRDNRRGVTTCTLIVDYKGLVDVAMRTGNVRSIHADTVHENDHFTFRNGVADHEPAPLGQPRGEVLGAYCRIEMKDGSLKCERMDLRELEAVRARSKSKSSGPWVTDTNEMFKKTVFKRATKWIRLSPEINEVITRSDEREFREVNKAPQASLPTKGGQPTIEPDEIEIEPEPEETLPAHSGEDTTNTQTTPSGKIRSSERPGGKVWVNDIREETGKKSGKDWTRFDIDLKREGEDALVTVSTFSTTIAGTAEKAMNDLSEVKVEIEPSKNERHPGTLKAIEIVEEGGAE